MNAIGRDEIYGMLRQEIVTLRRPPGSALSHKLISRDLNVSRTPVREAILRLLDDGLVAVRPRSGTSVSKINPKFLAGAQFVRVALETAAVRSAAEKASKQDLLNLQRILDQQANAISDTHEFYQLDEEFHRTIFETGKCIHAWGVLQREKSHLERMRYLNLANTLRPREIITEHAVIIAAISAQDVEGALTQMRMHLDAAFSNMLVTIKTLQNFVDP